MTVTFISNYINHHQIPFSDACSRLLGEEYHFIQTQPMEKERLEMGWSSQGEGLAYVHCLYQEEEKCRRLVRESDVLLAGWSGREDLVQGRLNEGKLTLRVSERLYREGQWRAVSPRGLYHKYLEHTRYRNSPAYLLCAGAYVPSDFHLIRAYPGKMLKWGYFPEMRQYTPGQLKEMKKKEDGVDIAWAGRFIPLKHPEYMLRLAKSLKSNWQGRFRIHMAGSGVMEQELKALAQSYQVADEVVFYGYQTPGQVRELMERCHIFVFTSNHLEGWGAVVNEAMNSACGVVANGQAGAVPYLVRHGENGMAYPQGSYEKMEEMVRFLMANPQERDRMGQQAYRTITGCWNAQRAAKALLGMAQGMLAGEFAPAAEGPCSLAEPIAPGKMYGRMLEHSL
ncbi:D-inositol 3-phosphate glycosyltransferase [Lachnospiraceae bacterium]|nr:D-inositol 3-phosphate glycosyltransferase [Lachnospiraceae bacterium]